MALSEIQYSTHQIALLQYLKEIGVVLETVIFNVVELEDIYAISKIAAKDGMIILAERLEAYHKTINLNDYALFKITISPDEDLFGKKINFQEFIGEGYDIQTDKINLFSYDPENRVIYHKTENGFAKALLNPPYPLKFENSQNFASKVYEKIENDFFIKIIKSYLDKILHVSSLVDSDFFTIISWSDNWTNYFESGKDWWGTFCWTVYDKRNSTITFIAASSTD